MCAIIPCAAAKVQPGIFHIININTIPLLNSVSVTYCLIAGITLYKSVNLIFYLSICYYRFLNINRKAFILSQFNILGSIHLYRFDLCCISFQVSFCRRL